MRFRLSDEDRERLGAPEWVEYDPLHLSTEDAEALEAAGGDWRAWGARTVTAFRLALWLTLHRSGSTRPFGEVHFDLMQMADIVDESLGKAPSESDGSSTPSPSATSRTGTSRRKK